MMPTTLQLSAETRAVLELKRWIESEFASDEDKDQILLDAIEGETRFNEIIAALAREARVAESMAEGIEVIIAEMRTRMARLQGKADKFRAAIGRAMEEAGEKTIRAPDATISFRAGQTKPHVESEDLLPDEYKRTTIKVSPDMRKIADYIGDTGRAIPGVVMRNGVPSVTIRGR